MQSLRRRDTGSAVVDFVLVGSLLVFLFLALVQLALTVYVRNVLIDCAAQGARFGALSDRDPAAGADRTRSLIREELSSGYARYVSARRVDLGGAAIIEVRVIAPLPVAGLIGVGRSVDVTGHALAEAGP
ncbi:TadE/TadG family type IV pilus assembly protein [Kineosporia sp. NBRC 101731]|uniref:TadE/TadG family type IV pilus assembly protein n=1 Tax=Kineosporia sp. NBRC 101731 TaxID=3032199 RepID=UPI00255285BD|nr:TadE/TadG family type IV pilus assembly protein [Kineosporia sp. NBRC 101731]